MLGSVIGLGKPNANFGKKYIKSNYMTFFFIITSFNDHNTFEVEVSFFVGRPCVVYLSFLLNMERFLNVFLFFIVAIIN